MLNSKSLRQDAEGTEASIRVNDACILDVAVYTNGFQGGDGGYGGETRLVFTNIAGADLRVIEESDDEIVVALRGDAELRCLAEGLRFIADVLDPYRGEA